MHWHVGGVQTDVPNPNAMGNHLVLTVSGLPSDTNPSGKWYVDAGLGDALHEPLPLSPGAYVQEPFHLALEHERHQHAWTLTDDPAGGFRSMTWTTSPALASDFVAQHEWLSTSPESGFVRVPMAERRDATGVDVIRGVVLARVGAAPTEPGKRPNGEVVQSRQEGRGCLRRRTKPQVRPGACMVDQVLMSQTLVIPCGSLGATSGSGASSA
ncbi:MAG: arylamine N-acetyltransferase [Nocardioidaceae bacterium]